MYICSKSTHTIPKGWCVDMIHNEELPIGFTMALAQHSDILNQFAGLSDSEQETIIEGAKQVKSRDEMQHYVESIFS